MGAALGLELILRIVNFTARFHKISAKQGSAQNQQAQLQRLAANPMQGTFGQVAAQFQELHPHLVTDLLVEALGNAVDFRNHLTHHFLAGHIAHLWTEHGIDIIAVECTLYRDHFQRIEQHVRDHAGVDFGLFEQACKDAVANNPPHPLSEWLQNEGAPDPLDDEPHANG